MFHLWPKKGVSHPGGVRDWGVPRTPAGGETERVWVDPFTLDMPVSPVYCRGRDGARFCIDGLEHTWVQSVTDSATALWLIKIRGAHGPRRKGRGAPNAERPGGTNNIYVLLTFKTIVI